MLFSQKSAWYDFVFVVLDNIFCFCSPVVFTRNNFKRFCLHYAKRCAVNKYHLSRAFEEVYKRFRWKAIAFEIVEQTLTS